ALYAIKGDGVQADLRRWADDIEAAISGEIVTPLSFAEWFTLAGRMSLRVCPNCKTEVGDGMCCMTYTEWHCWGCGARLDSRVVSPLTVYACESEWPDYTPRLAEPKHPVECSCSGRGWFLPDEHPRLRHGYQGADIGSEGAGS